MKYKCLVLDHDDTVVNSTASIHYPAFIESLKILRPDIKHTLEEHFSFNFAPGFNEYCYGTLGFTEEEMDFQTKNWLSYVAKHIPETFDGIREILWKFKEEGGYICVSSHSMKENILRDYKANDLPAPDMVFGWELPEKDRKPAPYALETIMKELHLSPKELVMVDDLKPGKDMADSCGVDFIAAGWAHSVPEIVAYMKANCDNYCSTVEELQRILFE